MFLANEIYKERCGCFFWSFLYKVYFWLMLPNFMILAFSWRQFYCITSKKTFVDFVSFFHTGAGIKKKSKRRSYRSIRTRRASPCTIFNKSKCLLWATWFILPNFLSSQFTLSHTIAFAFVEYGTRRCLSSSDRPVRKV